MYLIEISNRLIIKFIYYEKYLLATIANKHAFSIKREDSAAILKIDKDWIGFETVQDAHYVTLLLLVERFRRLKRN